MDDQHDSMQRVREVYQLWHARASLVEQHVAARSGRHEGIPISEQETPAKGQE